MKIAYTFPYKQFLSNGQAVFGEVLKDGSTEANMLIGDLSEIFRNFEEGKVGFGILGLDGLIFKVRLFLN
jgi:hypothetical protein